MILKNNNKKNLIIYVHDENCGEFMKNLQHFVTSNNIKINNTEKNAKTLCIYEI